MGTDAWMWVVKPTVIATLGAAVMTVSTTLSSVGPALALPGVTTVKGSGGQILSVTQSRELPAKGTTVRVQGKGFDETVGIYVALCVIPPKGKKPTPCGGGADKSGTLGASVWVSSNPPPYGVGVAVPYGINGKFSVRVKVGPKIEKFDCRQVACAIVTRADHLNPDFRGADVYIPVTFARK